MLANKGQNQNEDMSKDELPSDEGHKGGSTTHITKDEEPMDKGREESKDQTSPAF
jgi:hypothetical protein